MHAISKNYFGNTLRGNNFEVRKIQKLKTFCKFLLEILKNLKT